LPREGILVSNPYERITDEQVGQIHRASLQILVDPSLICYSRQAAEIFQSNGAEVAAVAGADHPCWQIKIPEKLVRQALDSVPKTVKLGARNRDNALIMKGDEPRVYFISGSETNIWLDVDFHTYVKKSDNSVELADLETISGYVDDLHELLKEGSLAERRAFIRSFVKEIRVTGNEAVLSYSIPLLPEKVAIGKEGVLPTVHYSGRYWT